MSSTSTAFTDKRPALLLLTRMEVAHPLLPLKMQFDCMPTPMVTSGQQCDWRVCPMPGAWSNAWRALEELGVADEVRKGHLAQTK